jgi:hypothetical protein
MTRPGNALQVGPAHLVGSYEPYASARNRLARPPHHRTREEVTTKPRHHEATSPRTDLGIIHLTAKEAQRIERAWKAPKQARTLSKPPTDLNEPTISSLDPLVM